MLTSCYAVEGQSDKFEGFILIVDDYSLNILNQTIKMRETLEKGVYGIEKIQLKRKPFPRLNAVYFVQPTIENLRKIADDFNAKDPEELQKLQDRKKLGFKLSFMPDEEKGLTSEEPLKP